MKIWNAYNVKWWPTIVLIDPEGQRGGGQRRRTGFQPAKADRMIAGLIAKHKKSGTLNEKPIRFDMAKFRDEADTPLYFPGKILADAKGKRLFIADSTHHRIVITDMDGKKIAIAGTGYPGNKDGTFDKAQFDDPQGMAVHGDTVYVADRKNNVLRQLDLKAKTVKAVPGTKRTFVISEAALECTPWDVWLDGERLFVAMSGSHQIWTLDLKKHQFLPFAGDKTEEIQDGPRLSAKFAQPSGLTSDGKYLYVADAEVSAVRRVPLNGYGNGRDTGRPRALRVRRPRWPRPRCRYQPPQDHRGDSSTRCRRRLPRRQGLRGGHLQQQDQDDRPGDRHGRDLPRRAR